MAEEIQKIYEKTKNNTKEESQQIKILNKKRNRPSYKLKNIKTNNTKINKIECLENTISESNSTVESLEEITNNQNKQKIEKKINKIKLLLKKINSKQNITTEKDLESINNKINKLILSPKEEKINLILDIDYTLVYSKILNSEEQKKENENKSIDNHLLKFINEKEEITLFIQFRKNLVEFFEKLEPYCNFYFNTMGNSVYAEAIIKLLYQKFGIKNTNNINIMLTKPNEKKKIPEELKKGENYLIIDDNLCAWETKYISSIIPSKKFLGKSFEDIKEIIPILTYQYYLYSNKIYSFNEYKINFYEKEKNINFSIEITSERKSQLNSIQKIIKKSFYISKILNIPIRRALHLIQNQILDNCYIYYNGNNKDFIYEIINLLGGINVLNKEEATHIIYNKNNLEKINYNDDKSKKIIDIKWIFDSFFNYKKFNENLPEYKIL